jgi:hypothetical protein
MFGSSKKGKQNSCPYIGASRIEYYRKGMQPSLSFLEGFPLAYVFPFTHSITLSIYYSFYIPI